MFLFALFCFVLLEYWIEHYCLDHRMHAAAMTMLYSGVRPQEIKAMTIENSVDFDNDRIYDSVSDDRSKKEAEKLNKTLLSMQNGMQKQKASP